MSNNEEYLTCADDMATKKYSAIIIDDEAKARRIMETLIAEHCPEIEVLESAEDVLTGIKAINKHNPEIVFLDIEMPGYTGFQLLDFFDDIQFSVIFTTAYSEYALQAFQVSAIDYLLKPIQIEKLVDAVKKVTKYRGNAQMSQKVETLKENLEENHVKKIALPMSHGLVFVAVKDIVYLKADGSYTHLFMQDGTKYFISKKVKDFEPSLTQTNTFFRTHRSYLINIDYIKEVVKQDGGHVVMENGDIVHLARERKEEFYAFIERAKI